MQKLSALEARAFFDSEEYLEPETIRQILGEEATDLRVLEELTYKVISDSEAPFVDFYVFENVVHILNGMMPDVEILQGALPEHIWYALDRISEIRKKPFEYSHEVKEYIKFYFKEAGMIFLPTSIFGSNQIFDNIREIAVTGPFPFTDSTELGAQAIKYARIREYLQSKKSK